MFWACFSWEHKSPCYIWPPKTPKLRARYARIMDIYNKTHKSSDKKRWIAAEHIRRAGLKRLLKQIKEWKYTVKTGVMERGNKNEGID